MGEKKEVEKQSKLDCLFPQTASDSSLWVTVPLPLFLFLCHYHSHSLWLPLSRAKEREDGGEGKKEREEEASCHGNGWWKKTRQVLLGCTPLLSLLFPFSLCYSSNPPMFSFSLIPQTFVLPVPISPSSSPIPSHCYPCLFPGFFYKTWPKVCGHKYYTHAVYPS